MMFRDVSPAMKHACFTSYETCFLVKTFIINNLHQFPFLFLYYCHCLPPNPVISPVDGWTIAFQANGPQGAWTTLWTGVDGPKRQPAHGPDHRDCPHPRAFAHALHRAKGVTGSPFGFVLGEGLVSQGGQIDLDAPEPYGFGSRDSSIDRLEDSPASPLAFQHAAFRPLPELNEVEVVAGTHRGGHNQGFREAPLIKHPLGLLLFHIKTPILIHQIPKLILPPPASKTMF